MTPHGLSNVPLERLPMTLCGPVGLYRTIVDDTAWAQKCSPGGAIDNNVWAH
jgi:hypothetical protein